MNKSTLWIMVGLSGSGKSSIAKQIVEENSNTVIISSDSIREELTGKVEDQTKNEEVFKIFYDRIRKNLEKKKNVIADATNLTMKSRRAIIRKVNGLDVYKIAYIVPKPFERCKEDNLNRDHPVPDIVLDKQIRRFQIPYMEEGFEEIVFHDLLEKYTPNEIQDTHGFDQKNPHHTMDLFEHCKYAAMLFSTKYTYPARFRIAALFHDIGKLDTQTFDENGIAHYSDHPAVGSYKYMTAMYHIDSSVIVDECFLVNYHMLPFTWNTNKAKNRWKERFGEYKYQMLLDFHECDIAR